MLPHKLKIQINQLFEEFVIQTMLMLYYFLEVIIELECNDPKSLKNDLFEIHKL